MELEHPPALFGLVGRGVYLDVGVRLADLLCESDQVVPQLIAGAVAVMRAVRPERECRSFRRTPVAGVGVGGMDQLVDQDCADLNEVRKAGARRRCGGDPAADAATFQHSPITRFRRARPF